MYLNRYCKSLKYSGNIKYSDNSAPPISAILKSRLYEIAHYTYGRAEQKSSHGEAHGYCIQPLTTAFTTCSGFSY